MLKNRGTRAMPTAAIAKPQIPHEVELQRRNFSIFDKHEVYREILTSGILLGEREGADPPTRAAEVRVCDYRAINAVTKKILPSLPLFENVVTQVEGARYFSVVDLTNQFYQIRVNEEDIENTAFRTPIRVYEFTVTPMGTTPSVGTAMTTMEEVLQHVVSHDGEQLPCKEQKERKPQKTRSPRDPEGTSGKTDQRGNQRRRFCHEVRGPAKLKETDGGRKPP
jgi:hypothetical protein